MNSLKKLLILILTTVVIITLSIGVISGLIILLIFIVGKITPITSLHKLYIMVLTLITFPTIAILNKKKIKRIPLFRKIIMYVKYTKINGKEDIFTISRKKNAEGKRMRTKINIISYILLIITSVIFFIFGQIGTSFGMLIFLPVALILQKMNKRCKIY